MLTLLLAFLNSARAGELWIPQSEIPAALQSHPRAVLLTRVQYDALVRDAQPPATTDAEAAPAPVVLRSLTMSAHAADTIVIAEAEMSVDVLSPAPAALPLHFEPATLASLNLDNTSTLAAPGADSKEPAALLPPGRHTLKATLHYPVTVSAAGHTIAVRGTPAGASSFSLTLPAAERIESALTWSSQTAGDKTTHTFQLPPGDKPHAITWSRRDIRDLSGTAIMQSCDYRYTLDAVHLHAALNMNFTAKLAALPAAFTLPVPAEARVLSVEGADVLSWELTAEKTSIAITLTPQVDRHAAEVRVELEMALERTKETKKTDGTEAPSLKSYPSLALPFPQAAGVHRASGRFTISSEGDLRIRRVTPPPLTVQSEPETRTAGLAGLWDFAVITDAPRVEVEELQPVFHATQDTQISLQRDAVHLLRFLKLVPRQGRLFQAALMVPAGEEIISVTLAAGTAADWHRRPPTDAGTPIEVHFPAGLKPGTDLALRLTTRLDPPQWNALPEAGADLAIARVAITGADKLSGFIAVATEDRFAVSTANVTGLEPRDPATLGDDVPLSGGFVWFAPGDFKLPLHIAPRTAEFDAHVAAFALPLRHGVEIEGSLVLDIRQSGLRALTVQLPPDVAALWRCESPAISGLTLDKPTGAWRITFRDELRGAQSLRWHLLLPVTEAKEARTFSASLPVLRVTNARRTDFHWVLEANTDTELSFNTAGLDERDALTLPAVAGYAPRHRVIAAWSARGGDWKLALTARRHESADLPALIIDRYDLTTSVSTGGTLRHNAVLTVRANGRQFFDIPLPDTARILSLLVNGTPQKPAASGTAALRAQLPPGDAAVSVSLTWEVQGDAWNSAGSRSIEPLRFTEDIPVIESAWTLRLPDGFVYSDFAGDLERVHGPATPEFAVFSQSSRSDATASAPDFLPGGGGDGAKLKMQILPSPASAVFANMPDDLRNPMAGNWLETQMKSITSQETMLRVVNALKLDEAWNMDPAAAAERLASMTEVEQERGGEIVSIRVRSSDEAESATCVRAIADAYAERRTELEKERVVRLSQTVDAQIKKQTEDVEKARLEMNELQRKHHIVDEMPLNAGNGISTVVQPGMQTAMKARDYEARSEQDMMKLETQLKSLIGLKDEQLIAGAMELGVSNSTIQTLYPAYQQDLFTEKAMLEGGMGENHPKIKALRESIRVKREQMEEAAELFRKNLEIKLAEARRQLEEAKARTSSKTSESVDERQKHSEYAAARMRFESQQMLLKSIREHSAKQKADEALEKKPVEILSAPAVMTKVAGHKAVAGLLPMEIALPDAGASFQFRGFHAPGALTFTARSLRAESRVAWLWIAAGLAAAAWLARRRTVWLGLLVALVLWLGPWVAGAGFGVCHRLLIGWGIGCVLLLCRRVLRARCGKPSLLAAAMVIAVTPHSQAAGPLNQVGTCSCMSHTSVGGGGAELSSVAYLCRGESLRARHSPRGEHGVMALAGDAFRDGRAGSAPPPPADVWDMREHVPTGFHLAAPKLRCQRARGADETPEPRILVPYDPAKPLASQNPQQLYVDYAHFQQLWQQARDHRLAKNEAPAPALAGKEAAILSALYEATLSGNVLKVEAALTIHANGEWAALDLRADEKNAPFAGAGIAALTLDGNAAVLHGGFLLMEKPGRHVLRASLKAPLGADWRMALLHLPASPATLFSLTHADASLRLRVNDGLPLAVEEKREPAFAWRGTAAAGAANYLKIERLPAVTLAAGSEKPALGAVRARLLVTPAIERLDSRIDFAFAGAERREFSFAFDAALTPVHMNIANLESWSLKEAGGQRVLDFKLSVPARDGFTAGFVAERAADKAPGAMRQAPAVVPAANRTEFTLELLSSDELELNATASGGWARSELQGMGGAEDTGFRKAGAWKLAGVWSPLTWTSSARAVRRSALADYAWKIAGGMIETTVTFTQRAAEHEDLSSLSIPLPAGAALQSLDGQRLADWWRDGDVLELRFSGATAETTTFFLDFTQPLTDAHWQNGVPLPCVTIPGYESVKGRAIAASGPETGVRLRLEDKTAREVEPEQARGDYRFLPPLLMRRGFSYEGAIFRATALLERVEPKFAVRWVLGAAVQDTWTETQFHADVEVKQGALPEVTFTLPAGMPEARVTGDAVRETVRKGDTYRVIFQSPVSTATALTIALELPHRETIALPDVSFPGAEMTERFLIMQNLSGGEIIPDMTASSGVEPLTRDGLAELHFTVRGFATALSWRLRENWKLAAGHRALETTSGPQAVVLYAELTTMLRPHGPEWLRAVYHLQNRALQFLPLRLPDGMQLVSVTVAGSPVRADAGTLPDGKPGLLIPLIQTRPGDLAMDVDLTCRSAGGSGTRALDDPDIPGVSIQRTLWNVWTPQGYELSDTDGNMERAEEGKSFLEKMEAGFSELDFLSSLASTARSREGRAHSLQQSEQLISDLEGKLATKEGSRSSFSFSSESGESGDGKDLSEARERLEGLKKKQREIAAQQFDDDGKQQFVATDTWEWTSNSSYLQKRGKDALSAEEKNRESLYTNPLINSSLGNGNGALLSLRKPPPRKEGDAAEPQMPRRVTSQIATLNDAPETKSDVAAKVKESPRAGGKAGPVEQSVQQSVQQMAQGAFNIVRGATRRNVVPPTSEASATPPAPLLPPAAGLPVATPMPAKPDADSAPPPPPPTLLKPAGRVSIPVTFPLDGTVHRFRKVNDGASLRLTMKAVTQSNGSRWLAAGLLAAGLGVLWLVNRMTRRRRT